MPKQFYTVKEVASRLNMSASSVYALVECGHLAFYRLGKRRGAIRISDEDLDSFLQGCRVGTSEPTKAPRQRRSRKLQHIRL